MADASVFVVEEMSGSDPIRVELTNYDIPFGRPRRGAAFDIGGPVNREKIYLDGRVEPIIHAKQAQYHQLVIRGHFRDALRGTGADATPSLGTVGKLERIRNRMRILRLTWGPLQWKAVMSEARFGVEGAHDYVYTLTFDVLSNQSTPAVQKKRTESAPADVVSQFRAQLADDRAKLATVFIVSVAANAIDQSLDALDGSLAAAQTAAESMEAAPQTSKAEAHRLIGRARECKDKAQAVADAIAATNTTDDVGGTPVAIAANMTRSTSGAESAYWAWVYLTLLHLAMLTRGMRSLQYTAHQRINALTRLYVVGQGDTLERIAATMLGSPARAHDLGYRPSDLTVGKVLRIPVEG